MKKTIAAVFLMTMLTSVALGNERHIKVELISIDNSGVSGFVQLTQLPNGGSNVQVVANGLEPETVYASFYYESADCSAPAELLGTFTGGPNGNGTVNGKIDEDLDEVGSISVRLGPDYGTLLACATVH